jgi:hypothetical protein
MRNIGLFRQSSIEGGKAAYGVSAINRRRHGVKRIGVAAKAKSACDGIEAPCPSCGSCGGEKRRNQSQHNRFSENS